MICNLCPRQCNVDITKASGVCNKSDKIRIAKFALFDFEEPCISGTKGSGAIFFSNCSLKCVFCQNYEISTLGHGKEILPSELAEIFKKLEQMGAHNINLVNPTHYVDKIIEAFEIYKPKIPVVYNTHGYERIETLKKIEKYVDIFLPDFKYFYNDTAIKYSHVFNYVEKTIEAIKFMRESKKDTFDQNGIMQSGLIIRHLILPLYTNESIEILSYIKEHFDNTLVSLMAQYTPYGKACEYKEIDRKITKREYDKVVNKYLELGLDGYIQERSSATTIYIPSWDY